MSQLSSVLLEGYIFSFNFLGCFFSLVRFNVFVNDPEELNMKDKSA